MHKEIQLYHGDLTEIPSEEKVDILFASSLPNMYDPVPGSLIYALHQKGISVKELARNKKYDYLKEFSCWMSKDIFSKEPGINFKNIVVFEPNIDNYRPSEFVSDIFRAIFPFASEHEMKIATPLLSSRMMLWGRAEILSLLVETAYAWMSNGMMISEFKVVIFEQNIIEEMLSQFIILKQRLFLQEESEKRSGKSPKTHEYDVFISYSHKNSREAQLIYDTLMEINNSLRIFVDKLELQTGKSWQQKIFTALEQSEKILALLSPHYLESKVCIEEFDIALLRNRESENQVLYPLLLDETNLPYYMRSIQYLSLLPAELNNIKEKLHQIMKTQNTITIQAEKRDAITIISSKISTDELLELVSNLKKVYGRKIPISRICEKKQWDIREVVNQLEDLIIIGKLTATIDHHNTSDKLDDFLLVSED